MTRPILGEGQYRYEVHNDWAKLPDGWSFTDVAAVVCDSPPPDALRRQLQQAGTRIVVPAEPA